MDKITIENFRCFRDRQTARLAPLTLLVGENSTGKTSFMALIRALWEIRFNDVGTPDFKKDPYDLGSFHEIAHSRGSRGGQANTFLAGACGQSGRNGNSWHIETEFESGKTGPEICRMQARTGPVTLEWDRIPSGSLRMRGSTKRGKWERIAGEPGLHMVSSRYGLAFMFLHGLDGEDYQPLDDSPEIEESDIEELRTVAYEYLGGSKQAFSGAPTRSRPRRTYDPGRAIPDPEGEWVPAHLAAVERAKRNHWERLKRALEHYGTLTGVFDELRIRQLGKKGGDPFQIQVRKHDGRLKGPWRNLVDVGYGVSQVLPLLIELIGPEAAELLLLQQPEVHLHPSAQAALGGIFCNVASGGKQLIVETHSDHLLDRVFMDVRDRKTNLRPEQVSVLFFERKALDVHIHSLEIDKDGNVLNAPDSYRRFFMEELNRSLGLG